MTSPDIHERLLAPMAGIATASNAKSGRKSESSTKPHICGFVKEFMGFRNLSLLDVCPAQLRGRESAINQEIDRKRRKRMRDLIENLISHLEHDVELPGFPRSLIELVSEGVVRALENDPDLLHALAYEVGASACCDRCGYLLSSGEPAVCSGCHDGKSVVQ